MAKRIKKRKIKAIPITKPLEKYPETFQTSTNEESVIEEPKEEKKLIPHEQLLEALFFFWDGFERAALNFFLVKDTAKQVIVGDDLSGDKLMLGVRKLEWESGQDRVFKAFIEHERIEIIDMTDNSIEYKYKDVPVFLYIYEQNPCLDSFDTVFYGNETFNTPNPFNVFNNEYDL